MTRPRIISPLTQRQIDQPERKPVLLKVGRPQRNYWRIVFWLAYGAVFIALLRWWWVS